MSAKAILYQNLQNDQFYDSIRRLGRNFNFSQKQKHTDKETQSPMLKVFKEMIQREKSDPEKTILIKKEKQENRKKKNYSCLNQKCDDISGNSSSTDRFKSTRDSKMAQDLQQQIYNGQNQDMAHSMPYSSEKKESWWFWKDSKKKKKQPDDTCSCVSCAFKKIISSDYVCIACLVLVFAVSLGVAFFVVYNSMSPICLKPQANVAPNTVKKEMQKARRQFRSDGETDDGPENMGRKNWKDFKDFVTNPWRSLPLAPGTDFGDTNLRDANYIEESGSGLSGALSRVLDTEKLTDGQTSDKLRDFYKRLIQTDARIKKLKTKTDVSNTYNTVDGLNSMSVPNRFKRSLMSVSNPAYYDTNKKATEEEDTSVDLSKFKLFYPPFVAVRSETNRRIKRTDDDIFNIEPSGIIIEKKKVMVQYAPFERKRNFPKCSHSPNLFKSHEKQLKHPFYRNSQRLDELLGQLLDKNIDKVVANPLNLDVLISDRDTCKHSKQDPEIATPLDYDLRKQDTISPTKPSIEDMIKFSSVKNSDVNLDADDILKFTDIKVEDLDSDSKSRLVDKKEIQRDDTGDSDRYLFRSTTPRYDLLLSISTLINSNSADVVKISKSKPDSVLKKRKLLQLNEEDDENLGYEDFKEVLADYTDSHDETDKRVEREKRSEDFNGLKEKELPSKFNVPPIYNQNWKGQMQLYPDELSFIMKQSAVQNPQNIKYDLPKDLVPAKEKYENSDTEYVEDNLSNKYAKLAQAYSDYGVFAGKKEYIPHEKSTFVTENDMFRQKYTNDEMSHGKGENIKTKRRRNSDLLSRHHDTTKFEMKSYNPESFSSGLNILENNSNDNSYSNNSEFMTVSNDKSGKESYDINEEGNQIIPPSYRIKRSLKSTNVEVLKNQEVKDQNAIVKDTIVKNEPNLDPNLIKEIKQDEINETSGIRNETTEGFGDILHILSDWFLTLAKLSGEFGNSSTLRQYNGTQKLIPTKLNLENITKDITYPIYDADMIDNIGHRSRALMAIKENISEKPSSTTNTTAFIKDLQSTNGKQKDSSSKSSIAVTTTAAIVKQTKTKFSENINKTHGESNNKRNRTVIKRSADSNLVFWNDIYDDEYGIKVDYFNNEQRSKHSVDNENFVKRSGQWINRKFRKLGDRFRTKSRSKKYPMKTTKRRNLRSVNDFRPGNYLQNDQNQLYGAKTPEEGKEAEDSFDFATLTANMKQICREAVKAVQKTRSINARQEIRGEFEATSLMQQLVRLMTDLIDFQVQQKTCAKLPPDLAEFLNWLTSPNAKYPGDNKFDGVKSEPTENANSFSKEELPDTNMPSLDPPFIREDRDDSRMELVNTLRAVKDLLHKYQELNNNEKIKLEGVKEYLEKQMDFLTKQLSTYEFKVPSIAAKLFRKRRLPQRRKRQMKTEPGDVEILRKPPAGKHVNKFVKIYGVRRTKTTSSYFDSIATENLRKKKDEGNSIYPSETPETTVRTVVTKNVTSNVKT